MLIKVDSDRSEAAMVIGDKVAQLLKENGKKVLNYGDLIVRIVYLIYQTL